MKRLTYISKFSHSLSRQEIEEIGIVSQRNNQRLNITGVLLTYQGIFFQILEGEEDLIENLYEKILKDPRHHDILCLKNEEHITSRSFPDWSMQLIFLEENTDILVQPIKALLDTLVNSQIVLSKYTQPSLLDILRTGQNPLDIKPEKVDRIIMFCDIFFFSTITEKLPVETVTFLLNQFFTTCTHLISRKGGEVTKFIGDCIMAYFDGDAGDNAIQASIDILEELETLRSFCPPYSPLRFLYTGIGLTRGKVIQGNIGSSLKMDYTIIGDAVNLASRLEGLTRRLPYYLLFDLGVKDSAKKSWNFVELGEVNVKGKEELPAVYSVKHPLVMKEIDTVRLAVDINNCLLRYQLTMT